MKALEINAQEKIVRERARSIADNIKQRRRSEATERFTKEKFDALKVRDNEAKRLFKASQVEDALMDRLQGTMNTQRKALNELEGILAKNRVQKKERV